MTPSTYLYCILHYRRARVQPYKTHLKRQPVRSVWSQIVLLPYPISLNGPTFYGDNRHFQGRQSCWLFLEKFHRNGLGVTFSNYFTY